VVRSVGGSEQTKKPKDRQKIKFPIHPYSLRGGFAEMIIFLVGSFAAYSGRLCVFLRPPLPKKACCNCFSGWHTRFLG